jgi:transcriptional regulator with PAS, ATPase and Fis domain
VAKDGDSLRTHPGPATREAATDHGTGFPVRRFRLVAAAGIDAGAIYVSEAERAIVGTHQTCDFVLHDPTVSRFHCEILPQPDGGLRLRDLDSTNGTTVDGVRVVEVWLRDGAVIGVGDTQLRVHVAADQVNVAVSEREEFGVMVGRSVAIRRSFALLERAAASDATVLLEGETGTGKELAAESIHRESSRKEGPFVVIDCGAIPSDLLESELFGHERGAFTGAVSARDGAFEAARGGTIFLDEIGELSADLQPKLLRVLEKREVKRVGANRYHPVDVRVVAATHRDLRAEVNAGRFRSDLYYRLAVLDVRLPPLRERREDLPLLVDRILAAQTDAASAAAVRTPELFVELERHLWPGNVRELRNYLERCVALREAAPLPSSPSGGAAAPMVDLRQPLKVAREAWLRPFEHEYLERMLKEHKGNVAAAARAAGIDRITFYRLLWRHGLK